MEEKISDYSKRLRRTLDALKQSSLSQSNKSVITGFADECLTKGLSKGRAVKYIFYLRKLAKWLGKDFRDATKDDIKRVVREIEMSNYSMLTKMELKITVRKVYQWLEDADDYPDLVKWIRCSSSGTKKHRLPEQILTKKEVQKLISVTQSVRDRAFVSMIYETGCRIGEILFLRLHSIEFDKHGAVVSVPHFGKTGSRRVRIVSSVPAVQEWLNKHPDNHNPEAYLWTGPKGEVMAYGAVRSMLSRLAEKAGIRKPVNPHAFRHARATHLATHLTEAQMKIYFGWTQSSEMAATYVHLSGRDVDSAILRLHGIQDDQTKKEKDTMTPKKCLRCELENPATNSMCSRCGLPLDEKASADILKADLEEAKTGELVAQLLKDDQIRDLLMKKVQEMPRS